MWFGDMAGQGSGNRDDPAIPGFAVEGRYGGGLLQGIPVRRQISGSHQDHVTAGHAAHMEPPVVGTGDLQAEAIVVRICFSCHHPVATGQ